MFNLVKIFVLSYNACMPSETKVIESLRARKKTLATAESCTGGLVGDLLTNIPGSSDVFLGGMVTYSNLAKKTLLKIPASTLKKHGAVSAETALRMAKNVRKLFKATFGIGISGIAGPGGGTKSKPVGVVFVAVAAPKQALSRKFRFKGTRRQVKAQAAEQALKLILKI